MQQFADDVTMLTMIWLLTLSRAALTYWRTSASSTSPTDREYTSCSMPAMSVLPTHRRTMNSSWSPAAPNTYSSCDNVLGTRGVMRCINVQNNNHTITAVFVSRVHSKRKAQNSTTFQVLSRTQICIFQARNYPQKVISKTRSFKIYRLQCNTEGYCTVLTSTVTKSNTVAKYWWHSYNLQRCQQMLNFAIWNT